MGINPTMSNFKSLTFDGKTSREYGVYITGEGVFNAPEKDVELVTIPGRNGDYALDHGRFSNIQVTYPASIAANNETDFRTAVSDFRNWLCSRKGYCVLSDEYNPSEYRLAVYKSGLEVTHDMLIAGEFNIVFDCKPQRFLTSGDTPVTLSTAITPTTATGSLVTFTATSTTGLVDLDTDIDPIQDLNGYDAPWVGGAGKNLARFRELNSTLNGITMRTNGSSIAISGTATANVAPWSSTTVSTYETMENGPFPAGTYTISCRGFEMQSVQDRIVAQAKYADGSSVSGVNSTRISPSTVGGSPNDRTFTATEPFKMDFWLNIQQGSVCDFTATIQLELGSTATDYAPYENICPISGHTEVDVVVSPTTDAEDGTTYTTPLGRTVYGGTLDVVSGLLTVTHKLATFDGTEGWGTETVQGLRSYYLNLANASKMSDRQSGTLNTELQFNMLVGTSTTMVGQGYVSSGGYLNCRVGSNFSTTTDWTTYLSSHNLQVWYPLATPQTYQLTPQHVQLLITNNVWSDTGDTTLKYADYPTITNSTQFASKPVIKVTGTGTVRIGNSVITITGSGSAMYIDCEIMEAWRISGDNIVSCNEYISATDIPVLESGTDTVFFSSGITGLEITPKWWKI